MRETPSQQHLLRVCAASVDRCTVIRVAKRTRDRLGAYLRQARRGGPRWMLRHLLSYPSQKRIREECARVAREHLRNHPSDLPPADRLTEYRVPSANGLATIDLLRQLAPDLAFQNGVGLLRAEMFQVPRLGTWNLHPSVLPGVRGVDPLFWALFEQRPEWIGCTLHVIDAGIDSGPIIARQHVTAAPAEHPGIISAHGLLAGGELLAAALRFTAEHGHPPPLEPHDRSASVYRSWIDGRDLVRLWRDRLNQSSS